MRVGITRFTCDRCGARKEQSSDRVGAPDYWLGLLVNYHSADSSIDHKEWRRYHWCPSCKEEFLRFVRTIDGASVEPAATPTVSAADAVTVPDPSCESRPAPTHSGPALAPSGGGVGISAAHTTTDPTPKDAA